MADMEGPVSQILSVMPPVDTLQSEISMKKQYVYNVCVTDL